eukprot:scaffold324921_cov14-Prasinocladus_malaysianus.AAC.1
MAISHLNLTAMPYPVLVLYDDRWEYTVWSYSYPYSAQKTREGTVSYPVRSTTILLLRVDMKG